MSYCGELFDINLFNISNGSIVGTLESGAGQDVKL